MRKFKFDFKKWDGTIVNDLILIIDYDLGFDMIIRNIMEEYDVDEIIKIENLGQVTREEYMEWLKGQN